jgi:hypothetical protein
MQDFEPAIKAFNQRLRAGGEQYWALPESYVPRFSRCTDKTPCKQFLLALEREQVRGGYLLTRYRAAIRNEIVSLACGPQLNLSEGLVNPEYKVVNVMQVRDLLQRYPLSYSLGPGNARNVREGLPKLLSAMGWTFLPVLLRARIISASNFLAQVRYLRHYTAIDFGLEFLRRSGIGKVAISMAQAHAGLSLSSISADTVSEFGDWADTIWNQCRNSYSLIAVRDRDTLNSLYPSEDHRFIRLKISCSGHVLGWAVLLAPKLSRHRYFGDMHVGSIVDCLAAPENAYPVAACATTFLQTLGVDLVVSIQSSDVWNKAFSSAGFLGGMSSFRLAFSPELTKKLAPLECTNAGIHMTRGDGEGPTIL